jgi:Ankyrin repeats (3 copies)
LWVIRIGCKEAAEALVGKGAGLESKHNDGRTPLSWAAEKGHEAASKLLLEKGADLEPKDKKYGRTPLPWAARKGPKVVVKLLLEKGADVESKDAEYGRTPLSRATGCLICCENHFATSRGRSRWQRTHSSYPIACMIHSYPNIRLPPKITPELVGREKRTLTIMVCSAEGYKALLD